MGSFPSCSCIAQALSGVWTRLLSSRQAASRMAFFPLLTSPSPFFSFPLMLGLFHQALGLTSADFLYACLSFGTRDTSDAFPFLFSSPLSPTSFAISSSTSRPRYPFFSFSPPPLSARASRVTSLSSSSPLSSRPKSPSVLYHVLCSLTSPITMCLCVGLSSLFSLLPFPSLLRLGSQPEIQQFSRS